MSVVVAVVVAVVVVVLTSTVGRSITLLFFIRTRKFGGLNLNVLIFHPSLKMFLF